jgi:hypothetical protein
MTTYYVFSIMKCILQDYLVLTVTAILLLWRWQFSLIEHAHAIQITQHFLQFNVTKTQIFVAQDN